MDSAFTVPQLHKGAASTMASPGSLLPQHKNTSCLASAMGNEFTVPVQGRIVSSERNGQRVHLPALLDSLLRQRLHTRPIMVVQHKVKAEAGPCSAPRCCAQGCARG